VGPRAAVPSRGVSVVFTPEGRREAAALRAAAAGADRRAREGGARPMTHRRVVVHRAGGDERLQIEAFSPPEPKAGEVRLAVRFAGVNYADCVVRMGLYESAKVYVGWPITPGFEVSGTVSAVGAGVTTVVVGDDVFAVTRFSGYATDVVVPANQVFRRPSSLK